MTLWLIVFLYLAHLVQGATTDITSPSCPPPDGATRSVWSLLRTCVLTLLICVWHVAHPGVPNPKWKWYEKYLRLANFVFLCFGAPEWTVATASYELLVAYRIRNEFREKKYLYEWSRTHSHFAQMGGFTYRDDGGRFRTIKSREFLDLCEEEKIVNPNIAKEDIDDKSKSDVLGKAIYGIQLLWFILQVAVRHSSGLAITLVELDTVSVAVLSLLVIALWLDKPLRPGRPHIFYSPKQVKLYGQVDPSDRWEWSAVDPVQRVTAGAFFILQQSRRTRWLVPTEGKTGLFIVLRSPWTKWLIPIDQEALKEKNLDPVDPNEALGLWSISFCSTWFVLGGIHLMAWNYEFPTQREKMLWRLASLVLTGTPLVALNVWGLISFFVARKWLHSETGAAFHFVSMCLLGPLGGCARALLIVLMLASLRALPCSAYQTISWMDYIPHL